MAVPVTFCLLSTFSCLICLRRSKQHKGLINAQLPERAPMAAQRATLNYTGIVERTDNSRVETWGPDAGANGSSALRPPVNRGQSQGSTKSLPAYEEEVQNGEVVLVEYVVIHFIPALILIEGPGEPRAIAWLKITSQTGLTVKHRKLPIA
ncbi:hypothetical protein RhiTH_003701 [Rhizoctonia solani]